MPPARTQRRSMRITVFDRHGQRRGSRNQLAAEGNTAFDSACSDGGDRRPIRFRTGIFICHGAQSDQPQQNHSDDERWQRSYQRTTLHKSVAMPARYEQQGCDRERLRRGQQQQKLLSVRQPLDKRRRRVLSDQSQ